MRRGAALLLLVAGTAVAAPPAVDYDDRQDDEKSFWARVEHPHRARYYVLVQRAAQLVEQNNVTEAIPLLREAVALEPGEPMARYLLARAYDNTQQWVECADSLVELLRAHPDFTPPGQPKNLLLVDNMAGLCLSLSGHIEEAIGHYQRVLASNVKEPQELGTLHWNLGDCFLFLGRLDEAIEQYALGVAAYPQEPMLHFALGVAYDRDEQLSRARDEIAQGLRIDAQLRRMGDGRVLYLPKADVDYYFGFAHQVASEAEPPIGDPLRRGLAIAYFRRYLSNTPDGPWVKRAREHLAELGVSTLREGEISVLPEVPEKGGIVKALLGAGPELQKCLEASPLGVLRASIVLTPPRPAAAKPTPAPPPAPAPTGGRPRPLTPPARPPAPPPQDSLIVASVGPEAPPPETRGCVEKQIQALKLVVSQPTRITVIVFAR